MTDEKMAEEFADNIDGLDLTCSLLSAKDKSHAYRLGRYDGFLAGLEVNKSRLDKAKELIKRLINACCSYGATGRTTAEAEQFLKEDGE